MLCGAGMFAQKRALKLSSLFDGPLSRLKIPRGRCKIHESYQYACGAVSSATAGFPGRVSTTGHQINLGNDALYVTGVEMYENSPKRIY
jgi:hypothetical protein